MRVTIIKTPKCYIGGAFVRSEGGRVDAYQDAGGRFVCHVPRCTRKDVRNAVEAAAKAGVGWAARSGYNRGQVMYRLAEMMESRFGELAEAVALDGSEEADARREVAVAIDRVVHYAGWADKYPALLGGANPVASGHFNVVVSEPVGVVGVVAPEVSPLAGLLALVLPAVVGGNAVVALASGERPYPALLLGEMLAVSDLPGGVVNLLTGRRDELAGVFGTHAQIRSLSVAVGVAEAELIQKGAAESVKRVHWVDDADGVDWHSGRVQGLEAIRRHQECKALWHPKERMR